ncbi:MAG: alpha-L-glutamate ligase, RimK family [Thermoleophilia bacterium]|nr:alpha-L-glutamate ligase, RimK family [Thermoleophilia bacterium]
MNVSPPADLLGRAVLAIPGNSGNTVRRAYGVVRSSSITAKSVAQHGLARLSRRAVFSDAERGAALVTPRRDVLLVHGDPRVGNNAGEGFNVAWLTSELRAQGADVQAAQFDHVSYDGVRLLVDGVERPLPEAVLVRRMPRSGTNEDLVRLREHGVHVTNDPAALRYANKADMEELFTAHGIAHVDTVVARGAADLDVAEQRFSYPMVVKDPAAAGGLGVELAADRSQLEAHVARMSAAGDGRVVLQRYHPEAQGRVTRVLFVRDRTGALQARAGWVGHGPSSDFKSNGPSSGITRRLAVSGPRLGLPADAIDQARRATDAAGLDSCAVDVIWTEDGWRVLELNPSPAIIEADVNLPRSAQMIPNLVDFVLRGTRSATPAGG